MLKVGFVVSSVTRSEYVFIAQRVKFANRQDPYIEKNLTAIRLMGVVQLQFVKVLLRLVVLHDLCLEMLQ